MYYEINSEWIELSQKLHKEPHFLLKRITPEALALAAAEDRIAVRRKGRGIIACCVLWRVLVATHYRYRYRYEIGTIFVDEPFRGNGLCKQVFLECIEKREGSPLFLITANQNIREMVIKLGWTEELRNWTKVLRWKRIVDPWGKRYPKDSTIKAPGKLFYNDFLP